ncbi:MAG TPA: phosphoribosylformylglycinamidine synthase subunit PurQ [Bryobacterales bacterium]|nr:phosphoribosylformylglycinamidine synthase subunit PurQ [Bryobacterales bacterium]
MKFGVVIFPGSNCDHDAYYALSHNLSKQTAYIWHQSEDLQGCDAVILPGGFSYGDYLRTGAIARFSPVMRAVTRFANSGGLVMGICNGFQILVEAGLLPGALLRNRGLHFICRTVYLRTETSDTPFTCELKAGEVLAVPMAHGEGCYFAERATLDRLEREDRIVFRYATPAGEITAAANPNGSLDNIAGIVSEGRNVFGMMPHPERASDPLMGSADGLRIFGSLASWLAQGARREIVRTTGLVRHTL